MGLFKKYNLKKVLLAVFWTVLGSVCIVLLAAGSHRKSETLCKGVEVTIKGARNNFFIGKEDVIDVVKGFAGNNISGKPIDDFNLVDIEQALKKEVWISKAELYFDNNAVLQAEVHEREPLARIFTNSGHSFYIDEAEKILPLSNKLSARVPVFTNFPSEGGKLSKPDSLLLSGIRSISLVIQKDSFLMAMIEQVAITQQNQFEMVPKIGDQLIVFGDANDIDQKFNKLRLFYKKVIPRYGWGRYNVINLQYKDQIVAKIKGKEDVQADSLRTMEMMKAIAAYTSRMASDSAQTITQDNERNSTNESIIIQSFQRDDTDGNEAYEIEENTNLKRETTSAVGETVLVKKETVAVKPVASPVKKENKTIKPIVSKPKPVTKPATVKPKPVEKKPVQPKAVMGNNDY